MKKHLLPLILILWIILINLPAQSIPPAYCGPLGNAEEPALRPYKWFIRGILAFGHQTKEKFIEGNLNMPIIGTVETGRGIRKGSTELLYSFWKGILFARPQQTPQFYKEETNLTKKVEADVVWKNIGDLACTGPAFPVLIAIDHINIQNDAEVKATLQKSREIQKARREAQLARSKEPSLSPVEKAQRNYIGDRAQLGRKNKKLPKNLLKLAK